MRLGIDIGGTKTAAVAIGVDGEMSEQVRMPTGFGADAVIETAVRTVARMAEIAGAGTSAFSSIGIGIPGAVDSDTGRVAHAVNLGLEGLDLGPRLADRLGVDVRIENDVKAAALGAHHLLGGTHSMAYLNLGTGLAAGIVLDDRLLRGGRGVAGEIGHIPVDPAGSGADAASMAASRRSPRARRSRACGRRRPHCPLAICSTPPTRVMLGPSRCATGSSPASPPPFGCLP